MTEIPEHLLKQSNATRSTSEDDGGWEPPQAASQPFTPLLDLRPQRTVVQASNIATSANAPRKPKTRVLSLSGLVILVVGTSLGFVAAAVLSHLIFNNNLIAEIGEVISAVITIIFFAVLLWIGSPNSTPDNSSETPQKEVER